MGSSEAPGAGDMTILVAAQGQHVAPRFDLCTEVVIARASGGRIAGEPRTMLLPGASADKICNIALSEGATVVVCGGLEEEHYQYLRWKKVSVLDFVLGPVQVALQRAAEGRLAPGEVLREAEV